MKGKDWTIVVLIVLLCSLVTGMIVYMVTGNKDKDNEEENENSKLFEFSLGDFTFKSEENEVEQETEKEEATNETKNETKSNEEENTVIEGTCIYCDGPLEADDKKSVCKDCLNDPMAPSKGKHMESTAPYGRCPNCNAANASDKGYQGDYCDECFAKIKEEEYNEKHKYGDCIDCGVYLSKNQSQLYGGRCPDCYAKYYGDNDTHMGSCERCGERVDLDHTNDGWGYNHLCSACTGELQMQESMEDDNPYAG